MISAELRAVKPTHIALAFVLSSFVAPAHCLLLQFEDFHSQSFIPNALQIAYRIERNVSINYNVTMLIPFPGKILFSVFVRKLASDSGERSKNMLKYKNLDFCKTLEALKNLTLRMDNSTGDHAIQSTFIRSCPLASGFYYMINGTVDDEIVPLFFTSGRYWLQFELVQVFDEVTKMLNLRAKATYQSRW